MKVSLDSSCRIPRSVTLAVVTKCKACEMSPDLVIIAQCVWRCSLQKNNPVLEREVCFDVSKRNVIEFNHLEELNLFSCIISHGLSSWMIRLKRTRPG